MNIIENIRTAIFNILASKMRTLLTTLGIIIGITSVVVITAIGKGYEIQSEESFASFDNELVNVSTNSTETIKDKDKIVYNDLKSIKSINGVIYASPTESTSVTINLKNPKETRSGSLVGANEDMQYLKTLDIIYGRFLNEQENEFKSKVCVIDQYLALSVFGRENVLNETIVAKTKTSEIELTVIGVYSIPEEQRDYISTVYIPFGTSKSFNGDNTDYVETINLSVENINDFSRIQKEITRILSINHSNDPNKYSVSGSFQFTEFASNMIQIVTLFIGFVASISLLVGGIGIMNIMLVTVTERTREIGIRKSLGATNNSIKFQFLIESMTVSLLGGFLGVALGYIISFITGKVLIMMGNSLVPVVSPFVVLIVFIISSLIGIVFGVYPAGKAAKLDPIEALRYE